MPSDEMKIAFDERSLAKHVTLNVCVITKKSILFRIGLLIIRAGCWIANIGYKEE
jgi:hypothetical protein